MKFYLCSFFLIASAFADVSHLRNVGNSEAQAPILKQSIDVGTGGAYSWNYETGNGIAAQEQGVLKNAGQKDEAEEVRGSAGWTAPDGTHIQLTYVANENGFQPQGAHLPVPPPVPEAILRALEYIKKNPPPPENSAKLFG